MKTFAAGNAEVAGLYRKHCAEGHPVLLDETTRFEIFTLAGEPLKVIPPTAVPVAFWSRPPSIATPQLASRSPLP